VFTSLANIGCGGRGEVNNLVDLVVAKERQRRRRAAAAGGGEDEVVAPFSLAELMEHLTIVTRGNSMDDGDGDEHYRGGSRRGDGGTRTNDGAGRDGDAIVGNDGVLLRSSSTDIRESMCHVASIAIGQFTIHLPRYVHWLVLRNPFERHRVTSRPTGIDGSTRQSFSVDGNDDDNDPLLDEKDAMSTAKRRGVLHRIASRRREKNEERRKKRHGEHEKAPISEGINGMHPIRRILEGASIFSHHRKRKHAEDGIATRSGFTGGVDGGGDIVEGISMDVDWRKWKYAMTDDYELSASETILVRTLAARVIEKARDLVRCPPNDASAATDDECIEGHKRITSLSGGSDMPNRPFHERCDGVPWGGIADSDMTRWWPRKSATDPPTMVSSQSDGGRVLSAYLKIMKWPADLFPKFPFRLCSKGCDSEVSLLHTLEWREKYRPWCVSNGTIRFNRAGFIYSRGHSNPGVNQRKQAERSGSEGHAMVWYRPGLASPSDDAELYTRTIINVLDVAVSDSLMRNRGRIGRFNIVMDCGGMSSRNSPSIASAKRLFSILQDHYPDRLGVLLAANLSGLTQMLMKMMLPFVTEDVRAKIHIVPNGGEERREMLLQFMSEDEIPYYLGGKDSYEYDANQYYRGKCVLSEDAIREYITTMPFHA
jgi:hypothetical protein